MSLTKTANGLEIQSDALMQLATGGFAVLLGMLGFVILVILQSASNSNALSISNIIYCVVCSGVGVCILLIAKRQRIMLGTEGTITINSKKYIGGAETVRTYQSADFVGVKYSTTYRPGGRAGFRDGSDIALKAARPPHLNLIHQWAYPIPFRIKRQDRVEPLEDDARHIAGFLRLPLEIQDLSTLKPF